MQPAGPSKRPPPPPAPLQRRQAQTSIAVGVSLILAGLLISGPSQSRPGRVRIPVGGAPAPALSVDVNHADARELALLPGVGPVLAERIVRNRQRHGRFDTVGQLDRVRGIGPKTVEAVAPLCVIGSARDHEPAAAAGRSLPESPPQQANASF